MRLKYQLFLTLLISSGLLIAMMAGFNNWSFNRGFLSYINDTEVQKLAPMVEELAAGFERTGDWTWITENRSSWGDLLDHYLQARQAPLRFDRQPGDRRAGPANGNPGDSNRPLTLDPRLLLADGEQRILIGPPRSAAMATNTSWLPIALNGSTVGYLGYRQLNQLPGQLDTVFAAQQKRSFAYAALAMILLSALLAAALAARIVRPLLNVNKAVSRISQGEYAERIAENSTDEIGDLARNINRLAVSLDKSLNARQQWLAEISHELRTPVAVLQGEIEAMQDGVICIDDSSIASLHAESLRLSRLISDLHDLTLSDLGALSYRFEPVDLVEVITDHCEAGKARAAARSITIDSQLPGETVMVRGDRQRLMQLLDNLIQNSTRYTDPGGTIKVSMDRQFDDVLIVWQDSAPGVSDAQLPLLFDPLYRTEESRGRETGGAGLGLSIAKKIVEAHEGHMEAAHSPLGGLAIHIRLPFQSATHA